SFGGLPQRLSCFPDAHASLSSPRCFFTPRHPSTGDRLRCKPPPFATEVGLVHPRSRIPLRLGTTPRPSHPPHYPRLPRHGARSTVARRTPGRTRQGTQRLSPCPSLARRPVDDSPPPCLLQRLPGRTAPQSGLVPSLGHSGRAGHPQRLEPVPLPRCS